MSKWEFKSRNILRKRFRLYMQWILPIQVWFSTVSVWLYWLSSAAWYRWWLEKDQQIVATEWECTGPLVGVSLPSSPWLTSFSCCDDPDRAEHDSGSEPWLRSTPWPGFGYWYKSLHTVMCEIDNQWEAAVRHRELSPVPCSDLEAGMRGGVGGSRGRDRWWCSR